MKLNNPSRDKIKALAVGTALSSTIAFSSVFADDTEVFFGQATSNSGTHPNVLFVMDTSGSMNNTDGTGLTRLARVKQAMHTILDETTNVNVGLMRFNGGSSGGAILHPVKPIDASTCTGPDCGILSVLAQVSQSDGDVEELADTTMDLDGQSLVVGETSTGDARKAGLHFENLAIPQGATITSAQLEVRADADDSSIAAFSISAEQVDSADLFTGSDNDLGARTLGQAAPWNPSGWLEGEDYVSADISPVIQEIVDRANWCGGNNINLVLDGTGQRKIRSFDKWTATAPTLRLTYTIDNIPTGSGCVVNSTVAQVSSGYDDAEERISTNNISRSSTDLEMHRENNSSSRAQLIGVRFRDLKIPQGAIIETAYMEFTTDEDKSGTVHMKINAEASGNAESYSSDKRDISNRSLYVPAVEWNDLPTANVGEEVQTPDISSALQKIVNRADWSSGNAAAFVLSGNGGSGYRVYESFNGSSSKAAKLLVTYRHVVSNTEPAEFTVRDELKSIIDEMLTHSGTPIVDAYYEAGLYMTGGPVEYGLERGVAINSSSEKYLRTAHPESWTGGLLNRDPSCTDENLNSSNCIGEYISGPAQYISPTVSSCQTNHIVFLTDGQPSSNSSASKVQQLIGADSCQSYSDSDELCGRELAKWLSETDHNPNMLGKQNISTYTIGFNHSGDFLEDLAREGDGQFFEADSASELVNVFKDILGDVLAVDTSFVAPGATVNQFNRLTHRNDIYFALFKPDQRPTWDGNLKRYSVDLNDAGEISILDANNKEAVDASTGFFHTDSKSWWSGTTDGNIVASGGAADELHFNGTGEVPYRRVFTYVGDYATLPSAGADLTNASSKLHENNSNITLSHLGIQGMAGTSSEKNAYREALLKWTRGLDVKDENDDNSVTDYRRHMGDPMHSRPVIFNYATASVDPEDALSTVFMGTNEGYLHAIDRKEGKELFGFMPKELLSNINPYFDNQSATRHPYGLDGALTAWTNDLNNNVMIDANEKAYLYAGMRRGGKNYYALDVSNRLNPKLAWVIEGGPGGTPGFEELGQTWSRAVPNKIMFKGNEINVLVFAAGYDVNQDPDSTGQVMAQTPDSMGRGFYIVNAETGDLIWSVLGGNTGMQTVPGLDYSVPSDIRALDTNNDGFTDQLYFGDMGGRIWRFDFKQYHQDGDGDLLQGGIFADLSGNSSQNHRRFYYEPDTAVIAHNGERYLSISIGSGWRAHPLNTVINDRFYVLRSNDVLNTPDGYGKMNSLTGQYSPITEADLIDVTNDIDADAGDYGWYMKMTEEGEKVLGDSVTVNNQVIFSSYKPSLTTNACTTAIGGGAVYVMNILNGSPRVDLDGDGDVDENDRETELSHGGIPPEPAVLITEHGPTVLVGPEQPVKPDFQNLTQRTYWFKPGDERANELMVEHTEDAGN